MEQMKLRFVNAVTNRLTGAPQSAAKSELIEELSDNLYQRYAEMTAAGLDENAAFDKALDELGDTEELVDYLKSLAPDESLPRLTLYPDEEAQKTRSELDDLLGSVNDIVSSALETANSALSQAKDALKKASKTGSWHSNDGAFELHFDNCDDDHGEHPLGEDHEEAECGDTFWQETADSRQADKQSGFCFSFGFDREQGGFFARPDHWDDEAEATVNADGLRGIDIQVNGDVSIFPADGGDIRLGGDVEKLEIKTTEQGVLAIRQGRTASSSVFFQRGLSSAQVLLYLPYRRFEFIQVSSATGDVTVNSGVETDRLSVRTASGDLRARLDACGALYFKSASGDLTADGLTGVIQADTISGDIRADGHLERAAIHTMSGDIELSGSFRTADLSTMSGDIRTESALLPETAALSSKSGDCAIRIPDSAPFTLRFKTVSGEFRSALPLTRTSDGALYQGGGTNTLSLTSVSGDLHLEKF